MSRLPLFGRVIAGATLALAAFAAPAGAAIAPDGAHSPNAEDIRTTYWVMLFIVIAVAVPAIAGLIVAARRFRSRGGSTQPRRLAAGRGSIGRVGGILTIVALGIFVFGVVMTDSTRNAVADDESAESLDIDVVAQQWLYRFEYPAQAGPSASEGIATVFSYSELVVPVDTTINLHINSTDVIHSWFIPALGPQVWAVPGEISDTSFRADEEGFYEGRSTIFAGTNTAALRANVRVVSREEYDLYIEGLGSDLAAGQEAVQEQVGSDPASGTEPVGQSDTTTAERPEGPSEE
jgi:heme/copper-type cytochrome/quinol oxidase subunit 2